MSTTVLYLSDADVRQLLDMPRAIALVEEVCRMQAAGSIVWPEPRMFTMRGQKFRSDYRVKACSLEQIPASGVRAVGVHIAPDGSGSGAPDSMRYVLLNDPRSGVPLAIVDEHWSYALRTTAAGCAAAKYLARADASVVGLLGVGNMGRTSLLGLKDLFPIREVRATSRRPETRERFAREVGDQLALRIRPLGSAEEVVRGADIVITGTTATQTLVHESWLQPGAFVCALGRREIEPAVFRAVDKFLVDDWEQVFYSKDITELMKAGDLAQEDLYGEVWEVVTGKKPGRERPEERVLVRIEGLVSQDVAIAHWLYRAALQRGMGTPLPGPG